MSERPPEDYPTSVNPHLSGEATVGHVYQPDVPRPDGVPGYDFLAEAGRGGSSVVYKALHRQLNRIVALKMILAGSHASAMQLARFRQEAETVARLQHPNIVQLFEIGEHAGSTYLALEYVEGGSLAQKTAGVPQSPPDAARLVELLARAVEYAHASGIVHRDLTPSNVLLTADGAPKLTDFGLARRLDDTAGLTATGTVLGTPGYLAPEQARGDLAAIGPATDVYGLGAILYYLLTGRPPFQAATAVKTVVQTVEQEPVPPHRHNPSVPRDLETICLKCLAKDPGRRYATAADLADDLRRFLADEPIRARPVGRLERAGRWCRRNPWLAGMAGVTTLLLLLLAISGILFSWQLSTALDQAKTDRDAARAAQRLSLVAEAKAGRFSRLQGQRVDSLAALRRAVELSRRLNPVPHGEFEKLRNLAVGILCQQDLRPADQAMPGFPGSWELLFHADGRLNRYVILDETDKQPRVVVRRTAEPGRLTGLSPWPKEQPWENNRWQPIGARLSGDGRHLGVWCQHGATLWDLEEAVPRRIADQAGDVVGIAFAPDNRHAVVGLANGMAHRFDLAEKRWLQSVRVAASIPRFERGTVPSVLLGNDRHLAVWQGAVVRVVDLVEKQAIGEFRHAQVVDHFAWHPDGRTLAVAAGAAEIALWDVPTRRALPALRGHTGHPKFVAFLPDSGLLVSVAAWGDSACLWQPQTGDLLLRAYASNLHWLHAVTNDRLILSGQVWDVFGGSEYRSLRAPLVENDTVGMLPSLAVHRDGRVLAVGGASGVLLWDLTTGRELGFLNLGSSAVGFEASGALLTQNADGLHRWPLHPTETSGAILRLGPPERLASVAGGRLFATSPDGRQIAWANGGHGSLVLDRDRPEQLLRLQPQRDVRAVAVSPDGRYVATGNWWYGGLKVWLAHNGQEVGDWPDAGDTLSVTFSGDGRYLASSRHGGTKTHLRDVGTWQNAGFLEGCHPAFSPDGTLIALQTEKGPIRLVRLDNRQELVRLETPGLERAMALCFSPDGTRLVARSADSPLVHTWDLRRIRDGLKALDLDWDAPLYPAEPIVRPLPLRLDVVGAEKLFAENNVLRQATERNEQAWIMLAGPPELRNPVKALELAREAVRLAPKGTQFLTALGVAQYRTRAYREAITTLEMSLVVRKGQLAAFDLCFLAMSHAQLGDTLRARDCLDRAIRWIDQQKDLTAQRQEELQQFRDETEAELRRLAGREM